MTIAHVSRLLNELAPLANAEDFDNVGLLVGDAQREVTGILVTLDTLEATVDEAISKKCNLIVSFHPIIFSGIKSLTGKNYVERTVLKAIKNDIAIYAIHTALDNVPHGVSKGICDRLNLTERTILVPKKGGIKKLMAQVPNEHLEEVREALFMAGAGTMGNYEECSFTLRGKGTFRGNNTSNPVVGEPGERETIKEVQLQMIFSAELEGAVLDALHRSHPYEEVAHEVITVDNANQNLGMGMIGHLPEPMDELVFLRLLQKNFNAKGVRHSQFRDRPVSKVAVLGGSGAFAIAAAKNAGADALITADLKYHEFYTGEGELLLVDIGHYESEQFTKNILVDFLTKKISSFAVLLSEENTNPIKYL